MPFGKTLTPGGRVLIKSIQETEEEPYEIVKSDNEDMITPGSSSWTTSFFGTVIQIINGTMGPSLLIFPHMFALLGLGLGLVSLLVTVSLMYYTLRILGRAAYQTDAPNYQEAVKAFAGSFAGKGTSLTMAFYCLGICSSYMVVIAEQVGTVICSSWVNEDVIIVIAGILLFPLMMMPDITFLTYTSTFGVVAQWYIVFVLWYHCIRGITTTGIDTGVVRVYSWGTSLGVGFALYTTALKSHHVFIPIVAKLQNRTQARIDMVLLTGLSICVFLFAATGVLGYLNFGSTVEADILAYNLPNDTDVKIARIALAIKCMMNYPLIHFAARMSFADCIGYDLCSLDWRDPEYPKMTYLFLTMFYLMVSMIIGLTIQHMDLLIELNGAVLGALQVYFWPAVLFFFMQKYPRTLQRWFKSGGIIVFSFSVMFFGIYYYAY